LKLTEIRLRGFKSLAFPTYLPLDDGITVIVGPNGCGKSNIVDAIRWALGEHSSKTLRTTSREDVIFAGSRTHPPASSAVVTLVFEHDGEKIEVERYVDRDGKARYLLNGTLCRLRDIQDVLKGTGLNKDMYAIIGQGQVERVVNASPEKLRELIEEAAEISVYKERKEEALARLEVTQQNLQRLSDKLQFLGDRKKSLFLKAKRAERFLEYRETLKKKKRMLLAHRYVELMEHKNGITKEKDKLSEEIRSIQKRLVEVEAQWRGLREEFSSTDSELRDFADIMEEYKKRQNTLLELKDMFHKRLSERKNALVEVETQLEELKKSGKALGERAEHLQTIIADFKKDVDEIRKKLVELESRQNDLLMNYSKKEKEYVRIQNELAEKEKLLLKLENEISKISSSMDDYRNRLAMLKSQKEAKEKRIKDLDEEIARLENSVVAHEIQEEDISSRINRLKQDEGVLEAQLDSMKRNLDELTMRISSLKHERGIITSQLENYQSYSRAVRVIFENKDLFPGVVDTVGNLIKVPEEFETAVTVLLGNRVQDVVVENVETAKKIIEFLKSQDAGRVTLLPLDNMKPWRKPDLKIEHEGFRGYVVDLVGMEPGLSPIMGYLFGSDVLVNTLDDAVEISRAYNLKGRIATLDGQIIFSSGAMMGGSVGKAPGLDILAKRRKLVQMESEIEQLNGRVEEIRKVLERKSKELERLRGKRKELEEELLKISSSGASARISLREAKRSRDNVEAELKNLMELEEEYTSKYQGLSLRKDKLHDEMNQVYNEVRDLKEKLSQFDVELQHHKKLVDELRDEIVNMRLELSTKLEKQAGYEEEYNNIKKKLSDDSTRMLELQKKRETTLKEIEKAKAKLKETEKELESLRSSMDSVLADFQERRKDQEEKLRRIQTLEKELERMKDILEDRREKMHKLDLMLQEVEISMEGVGGELLELLEDGEKLGEIEDPFLSSEDAERVAEEVKDLEQKLKHIGTVDLNAINEYEEVETEYDELRKQFDDLQEAREKLLDIIDKADREARARFLETFEEMDKAFDSFVSILFDGGHGELRLTPGKDVLEAGVEISITKPGRGVQKLPLLSGGEKALVAIALIFALMTKKPSPFYILDEIDAALDDINAERFKRLLLKYRDRTQFLVITHNKIVMEAADLMHGVTMENGITRIIPVRLKEYAT